MLCYIFCVTEGRPSGGKYSISVSMTDSYIRHVRLFIFQYFTRAFVYFSLFAKIDPRFVGVFCGSPVSDSTATARSHVSQFNLIYKAPSC